MTTQWRNWCFTENAEDSDIVTKLKDEKIIEYAIVGKEICPTTGKNHLQGYAFLRKKTTLMGVKKLLSQTAHFERAEGSHAQNKKYCSKDGDFEEFGTFPKDSAQAGRDAERARWENIRQLAKEGKFDEIDAHAEIAHYKTLRLMHAEHIANKENLPHGTMTGIWIHGPAGVGKSTHAEDMCEGKPFYEKDANKWWDGYQGEEFVILDDLHMVQAREMCTYLKKWADRRAFNAEIKGGMIQGIRPKKFIVTSQYSIDQCYIDIESNEAIKRRFDVIKLTHWKNRKADKNQCDDDKTHTSS